MQPDWQNRCYGTPALLGARLSWDTHSFGSHSYGHSYGTPTPSKHALWLSEPGRADTPEGLVQGSGAGTVCGHGWPQSSPQGWVHGESRSPNPAPALTPTPASVIQNEWVSHGEPPKNKGA